MPRRSNPHLRHHHHLRPRVLSTPARVVHATSAVPVAIAPHPSPSHHLLSAIGQRLSTPWSGSPPPALASSPPLSLLPQPAILATNIALTARLPSSSPHSRALPPSPPSASPPLPPSLSTPASPPTLPLTTTPRRLRDRHMSQGLSPVAPWRPTQVAGALPCHTLQHPQPHDGPHVSASSASAPTAITALGHHTAWPTQLLTANADNRTDHCTTCLACPRVTHAQQSTAIANRQPHSHHSGHDWML